MSEHSRILVADHYIICKRLGMFRPHVPGSMFVVSSSRLGRYQLQGLLGVGCDADTGADFSKRGRGFIDLDVDMGVFEQPDGSAKASNASADDRDTEGFGRGGR